MTAELSHSKIDFRQGTHARSPRSAHYNHFYNVAQKSDSPYHHHNYSFSSSDHHSRSSMDRGLPPPSAMTLPDLSRAPPAPIQSQSQSLGVMPAPPIQWHGAEESMRNWLNAKAEEERRKQEEERTRQESFRLEQRRIEQSMLRESMQGGVPPQMVPIIFAGIGSQSLANTGVEWLQQYAAQMQASQHRMQISHERGMSSAFLPQDSATVGIPLPQGRAERAVPYPSYTSAPADVARPGPHRGPVIGPHAPSGLSRLNTVDLNPPTTAQAPQQQQSHAAEQDTSPSIYFHHWMPPATQETKGTLPPTPSAKEPASAPPHTENESEYTSPKKRKATGSHQVNGPPTQISPSLIYQVNHRRSQQTHSRSQSSKVDERVELSRRDSVATCPRPVEEHRFSHDPGWPSEQQGVSKVSPRRDTH